jgi:hypothetical protein
MTSAICNRRTAQMFKKGLDCQDNEPNSEPRSSVPDLGITDEPRADHAQYLAAWLCVLKADKKAIFTAALKASEAAAFLAGLQAA